MIPWSTLTAGIRCLRCVDTKWVRSGSARGWVVPCPDCQPGAAVLALKRGHRR